MAPLVRKNGWTLAEEVGHAGPDRIHRALNRIDGTRTRSWTTCASTSSSTSATGKGYWSWTAPGSSHEDQASIWILCDPLLPLVLGGGGEQDERGTACVLAGVGPVVVCGDDGSAFNQHEQLAPQ